MSNIQNEQWVAAAKENFEDALETENYQFAKDIIGDVRDAGFTEESDEMQSLLMAAELADN